MSCHCELSLQNGKCESAAAEDDELGDGEDSREPPPRPEVKKTELMSAARVCYLTCYTCLGTTMVIGDHY